jgi:hypothetical protein
VTFKVDGHEFILSRTTNGCQLLKKALGQQNLLVELAEDDSQFEDHLLVALGEVLETVKQ